MSYPQEPKIGSAMSNWAFVMTATRIGCTFVGLVTLLMWIAGCIGIADFSLRLTGPAVT